MPPVTFHPVENMPRSCDLVQPQSILPLNSQLTMPSFIRVTGVRRACKRRHIGRFHLTEPRRALADGFGDIALAQVTVVLLNHPASSAERMGNDH